jgi:hypothetical protein
VYTPSAPSYSLFSHIAGDRIWMEMTASSVVSFNSDGSSQKTVPGARLIGCLFPASVSIFNDEPCDAVLVVVGNELRAYDGATGTLRFAYGSLPAAPANMTTMYSLSFLAGWGQGAVLTQFLVDSKTAQMTAYNYYMKSDQPGLTPVAPP